MRTYEKYKDSGISWIGKVPEDWRKCRFKNIMNLITDASTSNNKIGLENIESGTGKFVQTDSEFEGNGVAFMPHDIVYGKLRPYLQKVWCADFEGNAVGDFFVFRNKCNSVSSFLKYVLLSNNFTQFANGTTYGAKMPRVSSNAILDQEYYIPTLSEQEAIANYLDKKTAEIDKIIAEREKKIELLNELKSSIISRAVTKGINPHAKMKDSGIDWIGEIPEDWEVCRLSFFVTIKSGDMLDKSLIKDCNIYAVFGGGEKIGYTNNYNVLPPAIIIGRVGARCGCVTKVWNKCWATDNALILHTKLDNDYCYYLLSACKLNNLNTSSAQPLITATKVKDIRIPIPSLNQQYEIVSYLKNNSERIDKMILNAFSEISLLRDYKQSLISEVVTGKRKVID